MITEYSGCPKEKPYFLSRYENISFSEGGG
jgi:hypothetical protein